MILKLLDVEYLEMLYELRMTYFDYGGMHPLMLVIA